MTIIKNYILSLNSDFFDEFVEVRNHLHKHPELSFQEYHTSDFIKKYLSDLGLNFSMNTKTGIVGYIEGKKSFSENIVLLRADIDALPIYEKNDVPYKSLVDGVMHACGHDVHTASLLGVLKIINNLKNEFSGKIKFVFQPGEEKLPGGAKLMIDNGLLNDYPKYAIAQHVFPELEVGKIGFKRGQYMASCDEVYIDVIGKGGHGAMPHLNIDPVVIGAQIISSLQSIISRYNNPIQPSVLSFGRVFADGATNVIPDKMTIEGTFRTLDETWRYKAHQLIENAVNSIAEGYGAKAIVKIIKGYPSVVNDSILTTSLKDFAIELLGEDNVVDLPIRMTGEDFGYISQLTPSCFYRLGVRNEDKGIVNGVHSPHFDIDEKAIQISIQTLSWFALSVLNSKKL
jgi:amidohydrolase